MTANQKSALDILIAARERLAHDYCHEMATDWQRGRQRAGLLLLLRVYQRVLDG